MPGGVDLPQAEVGHPKGSKGMMPEAFFFEKIGQIIRFSAYFGQWTGVTDTPPPPGGAEWVRVD